MSIIKNKITNAKKYFTNFYSLTFKNAILQSQFETQQYSSHPAISKISIICSTTISILTILICRHFIDDTQTEKNKILINELPFCIFTTLFGILSIIVTFLSIKFKALIKPAHFMNYLELCSVFMNLHGLIYVWRYDERGDLYLGLEIVVKGLHVLLIDSNYRIISISTIFAIIEEIIHFNLVPFRQQFSVYVSAFNLLVVVVCAYWLERGRKILFYYKSKLTRKNEWLTSVLDNIQSGIVSVDRNKILFSNNYVSKKLNFLLQENNNIGRLNSDNTIAFLTRYNNDASSLVNSNQIPAGLRRISTVKGGNNFKRSTNLKYTTQLKRSVTKYIEVNGNIKQQVSAPEIFLPSDLLQNLENANPELDANLLECMLNVEIDLVNFLDFLEHQTTYHSSFEDFVFLGVKKFTLRKSMMDDDNIAALEIYLRLVEKTNRKIAFEFMFHDVTRSKSFEETKAQVKYKSLFLAKIAHEFKNPLIMIKELTEQINDSVTCSRNYSTIESKLIANHLNLTKNLSSYMLILVKDFEVMSKKERKVKIDINKTFFNIRDEMTYLKEIVDVLIIKKIGENNRAVSSLKFQMNIQENVPLLLYTDKTRLMQILINLLSNAIKFTQAGMIELVIEMCCLQNKIQFMVKDTGKGINEIQEKFLFQDFSKGEEMNNAYGSGLGLSVVKELCHLIGGEIKFQQNLPNGSVFFFNADSIGDENDIECQRRSLSHTRGELYLTSNKKGLNERELKKSKTLTVKKPKRKESQGTILPRKLPSPLLSQSHIGMFQKRTSNVAGSIVISPPRKSFYKNRNSGSPEHLFHSRTNKRSEIFSTIVDESASSSDSSFSGNSQILTRRINDPICINRARASTVKFALYSITKEILFTLPEPEENLTHIFCNINKFSKVYSRRSIEEEDVQIYQRLTIIITDDDNLVRKSILRVIDKYISSLNLNIELNLIEVNDGLECLYAVYRSIQNNLKIDLIISDETMNYMNGSMSLDILSKLMSASVIPYDIPAVIVSAYEENVGNLSKYNSKCVKGVFSKPLNKNILCEVFKQTNVQIKF